MATFAFESITAAQALAIGAADTLTIAQTTGTAVAVTVVFTGDAAGDINVSFPTGSVLFGPNIAAVSQTAGGITFADGSVLYIGDGNANSYSDAAFRFNPSILSVSTAAFGGGGDDTIGAGGAHDLIQGNAGNDVLTGGVGDDTIYGGQGNDQINVGTGLNFGQGNKGDDTLSGNGGLNDTLLGGQGSDQINGAGFLNGNLGDDVVRGSGQMFGEGGNDTLISLSTVNDTLSGGDGNDSIVAGRGQDSITGDAGDDTIGVTGGAQKIAGGAGADVFIFGAGTTTPGTVPAILDWSGTEDKLSFLGFTPNPSDFTSVSAADYSTAVTMATTLTTQNHFSFVGVQVGADYIIFAGGSGGPTSVVDLVGRSMADFTPGHNLI